MDGSRFDAWTRRRLGLAAGGMAASLLSVASLDLGGAKAKRKKKKPILCTCPLPPVVTCPPQPVCRNALESCEPGVTQLSCCPGFNCDVVTGQTDLRCCLGLHNGCSPGANQCCSRFRCASVNGENEPIDLRCCGEAAAPCTSDVDCCFGAPCIGGACAALSDRNLKEHFGSVDPADLLERVRNLPISTWNYTSDAPTVRHIGPMAQDFAAAFGVGADDRHIHPMDGQGVALAAIQGLIAEMEQLRKENATLAARLAALEQVKEGL